MLLFFIHGVATRHTEYAKALETAIRDEMLDRDLSPPICYPGFWGDLLGNTRRLWSILQSDLQQAKRENLELVEDDDLLCYKDFREGLFSEFVGDFFSYLNPDRGRKIRQKLSQQLEDFLTSNPNETELHIIAHSLGTVILWDVLFSQRLNREPETRKLRMMLNLESPMLGLPSARLTSITTMGSPIVFANQMLNVRSEELAGLLDACSADAPLRWTNIIHPADILAYPLKNSIADLFQDRLDWQHRLDLRDRYIVQKNDFLGKATKVIGQPNLAIPWKTGDAHTSYFKGREQNAEMLQAVIQTLLGKSMRDKAIGLFLRCSGITEDNNPENIKVAETCVVFPDGSGSIGVFVNTLRVYHVYVFDSRNNFVFGAYVGWIDSGGLKAALAEVAKFADAA